MKKVYMTLRETIPQAKPGSRDARPESLLYRLRTNSGIKTMVLAAIFSATLLLVGCGGNNQGENKPGNKDAQKLGDKIENPTGAQEKIFSNEVEFSPENIEAGVETAGLSILKESLEYLIEEGPEDIKAMDGNESAFLQGAIDAQLITSNPNLHKAKPEDVNFEDFTIEGVDLSKPKVDIVYDKGNEGEFIEEDYLSVGIEPPEGGSKTIAASFLVDREKFEFFSNEEEIKKAIKYLENGKLEGLKPSYMIYQDLTSGRSGEAAEDMDDYQDIQKSKDKAELYLDSPQDPEKTAKKLNKIWSELPEVLEINPSKLSLVKKLPENTNASFEEKSSAGEDQYSSEQASSGEQEENSGQLGSLETKEAALDEGAKKLAVSLIDELIEEDDLVVTPPGEQQEDIKLEESKGAFTSSSKAGSNEAQIYVAQGKEFPEDPEKLFILIGNGEEALGISFTPLDTEYIGAYGLEGIKEEINKPDGDVRVDGIWLHSQERYGEVGKSMDMKSVGDVYESDVEAVVEEAKTMAEEDFGVEVQ